jgi:hypothetical protein
MTQYLISVLNSADGGMATPEESAAIEVFNDKLQADGVWVFAGGLGGPGTATVIDARNEEPMITDGPYLEAKEHIVGFWIVEAPHLDAALKLAADGSKACNRRVEVRPFLDA